MHAMAGTRDGVLNHTVSGQVWQNLWFNGTLVGETGINAALCGIWGCPVLLVTGDDASCREGTERSAPASPPSRSSAASAPTAPARSRPSGPAS